MNFTRVIGVGGRKILFTHPTHGEINLGSTMEGSTLSYNPEVLSRIVNEYGNTPHDLRSTGIPLLLTAQFMQEDYDKFDTLSSSSKMTNGGTAVASSTLDGTLTQGATTITLNTITGFTALPESGKGYVITIEDEQILVKYVNATTLTLGSTECPVKRGYNGTLDVEHADTTAVDRVETVIDFDPRPKSMTNGKTIIRPIGLTTDNPEDIVIWRAAILPQFSTIYSQTEEKRFQVQFTGLIDETCDGKVRILRFGSQAVLVTESYFGG